MRARPGLYFKDPLIWQPGLGGVSQFHLLFDVENETIDEVVGTFGFRTLEFQGEAVSINGVATRLVGVNLHEQHPCFGNSVPGWQSMRDIKLMKQAGINAIRTTHYPHAQEFYDACDREGMLVLAELPCWQYDSRHFNDTKVRDMCVDMARNMVAQLWHHPSIIGWVIQNESRTFERGAKEFFTAINNEFKKADPTRFTLSAENPYPPQAMMAAARAEGKAAGTLPPTAALVDATGHQQFRGVADGEGRAATGDSGALPWPDGQQADLRHRIRRGGQPRRPLAGNAPLVGGLPGRAFEPPHSRHHGLALGRGVLHQLLRRL